jgi:hypothetical protein
MCKMSSREVRKSPEVASLASVESKRSDSSDSSTDVTKLIANDNLQKHQFNLDAGKEKDKTQADREDTRKQNKQEAKPLIKKTQDEYDRQQQKKAEAAPPVVIMPF